MSSNMIRGYNLNLQRKFSAQTHGQNIILLTDMPELIWELHKIQNILVFEELKIHICVSQEI